MKCEKCGGKTRVVYSKYDDRLKCVRRRRKCDHCGITYFTAEKMYRQASTRRANKK